MPNNDWGGQRSSLILAKFVRRKCKILLEKVYVNFIILKSKFQFSIYFLSFGCYVISNIPHQLKIMLNFLYVHKL